MDESKINKKEIIAAIEESGYLIEQRVEPIITSFGYYVESNDAYVDYESGKTREIDLFGLTGLYIKDGHLIYPILLVECENNKQPIVFFKNEAPVKFLNHHDLKLSGLPIHFFKSPDESISFSDFLNLDKFHHYCTGNISTQYCSFQYTEKRGVKKWIALHPEIQHDTFQNLIKCVKYKIDSHFSEYYIPDEGEKEFANIQIYYPLLILQGDLFEAYLENNAVKLEAINHIQFRKQIAKTDDQETYQIDVITEKYLPDFLKLLEIENKNILTRLKRKKIDLENSIEIIIKKIRKAKNESEIKRILEF